MMSALDAESGVPPHLHRLATSAWAWEFLRRNPDYRREAAQWAPRSGDGQPRSDARTLERKEVEVPARRWGLLAFRESRSLW